MKLKELRKARLAHLYTACLQSANARYSQGAPRSLREHQRGAEQCNEVLPQPLLKSAGPYLVWRHFFCTKHPTAQDPCLVVIAIL